MIIHEIARKAHSLLSLVLSDVHKLSWIAIVDRGFGVTQLQASRI